LFLASSVQVRKKRKAAVKILITGGAGFVGRQLVDHLLRMETFPLEGETSQRIDKITVLDAFSGDRQWQDPRVEFIPGDIGDAQEVARVAQDANLVWHLAAVVSSEAEANFDLGMRVNLQGMWNLLETLRASRTRPRLVNASSFAVFGGNLPHVVTDRTDLTPKSSYGMQKAIGELLVADYTRKGFVDGRSVRLPTITVRPGKPNKAASTFVSSIIREPLSRHQAVCPVRADSLVYISSPRRAIESMVCAMYLSDRSIGAEITIPLPGLTLSVGEMVESLERIAGPAAARLIQWQADAEIQRIVDSWPGRVETERARSLGFKADRDFEEIIRAHIEDESVPQWWRQ
jgi:nucleoside-diphosphate-sugar epimerase